MRWESKPRSKSEPKLNDIKYEIKFAWWPTRTKDGNTIWLEKYIVKYIYLYTMWGPPDIWSRESDIWKEMYVELLK